MTARRKQSGGWGRALRAAGHGPSGVLPRSIVAGEPGRRLLRWLSAAMVLLAISAARAQDVVYLANDSGSETKVVGTVLDYTGKAIRMRASSGLERNYAASRVVRIESRWSDAQLAADRAFAKGEYRQALDQYRAANRQEQRVWVRRKILAQVIWCYRALGEIEAASDAFLLLVASDPATPHFDCIPLAWSPSEAVSATKAAMWLRRDDLPVAKLLGASHLMSTNQRPAALEVLDRLATDADPRIAALATAQTWRGLAFRAPPNETDRWAAAIEKMPEPIRAGPYFVLARGLVSQRRFDEAALAYLRVPILYSQGRRLSAAALLAAGDALIRADRRDDAARLLREVIADYPGTPSAREAQSQLAELENSGTPQTGAAGRN